MTTHKINLLVILLIIRAYLASCVLNNDIAAVSTTHTLSSFPKHGLEIILFYLSLKRVVLTLMPLFLPNFYQNYQFFVYY
jgi:hypothetical protein